ncbi:alpha/beta hydrolase family protein [Actinomadura kijaniata]|uniref:alpha/beta hydrolase family protein n=1 Tax=Actinomadura kijaniata TaxID=46161 RepID=UPI0008340BDA|nr:alpha/beta hydrolase [Actinomadura kijaniata]
MRRSLPLAATLVAALLCSPATADARTAPAAVPAADQWDSPGPHPVAVRPGLVTTLYYPGDIASSGRRHPVIIWGNGTGATPSVYDGLLRHWASHGFIVAAANTPASNSGREMRAGIDRLATLNGADGPFRGRVDLDRVGATGHSQGGAGAINASADDRVDTTVPIQPGPLASASSLHGPVLYLAGQNDSIVPPSLVRGFYDASGHVPAIYAERAGATHFTPTGDGGGFRGVITAWFRHHLMDDARARGVFYGEDCGICADSAWSDVRRNARVEPVPATDR